MQALKGSAMQTRRVGHSLKQRPFTKTGVAPKVQRAFAPVRAAALTVKDPSSGVEFPLAQKFWSGEAMRCLGAGTRTKQVLLFNVKVYSAALYVEGDRCAKELGIRSRGGFFESDDDYCQALMDGAFSKALLIQLVRDVDGATFSDALEEALAPRMRLMGESATLAQFKAFFEGKNLTTNTQVAFFWSMSGELGVTLNPGPIDYSTSKPQVSFTGGLPRGLFELYLGSSTPVVPEARQQWVQGAKNLLDYDSVKRNTRLSS